MATYKILYWQDIPTQVRAEDGADDVSVELSPKFMARVDRLAMELGREGSDDYLEQWRWSEEQDRPGSARAVAEAVRAELEAQANW